MDQEQESSLFVGPVTAARDLVVSVSTIYGWSHRCQKLRFPLRKHGRKSVFLREELRIWSDWRNGVIDSLPENWPISPKSQRQRLT